MRFTAEFGRRTWECASRVCGFRTWSTQRCETTQARDDLLLATTMYQIAVYESYGILRERIT
jgi:hypothetical protein